MESAKRKTSPTKGRSAKRAKKPSDGIKKPTSAYIYFVSDYRMVLKKKGKDTSQVKEVAKLCGHAWQAMTDEEKKPYQEKYKTDRERYLKEKEALDKKMGKDPNKPKRPQTAYFCFLAEFRKEMAGKELKDGEKIPQLAGERWRLMDAKAKVRFEELVIIDKERYAREMEEYKKEHPDVGKKPVPKKKEPLPESSDNDDDDSEDGSEEEEDESDDSD